MDTTTVKITGRDTYTYRDEIRSSGFKWNKERRCWEGDEEALARLERRDDVPLDPPYGYRAKLKIERLT